MVKPFIQACYQKQVDHLPVWLMRQAGRYLPSYRKIRKNYTFSQMYKEPEIATEVTLLPFEYFELDAAVIFSDILVVPEAMGMELEFIEKKGPVFRFPLRTKEQIDQLQVLQNTSKYQFLCDTLKYVRQELPKHIAVLGFCGAPWTLAVYMIEGQTSKEFHEIMKFRYEHVDLYKILMEKITQSLIQYCKAQIQSGAEAIQIFDTWLMIADEDNFLNYILPSLKILIKNIKQYHSDIPIIYFAKRVQNWLPYLLDLDINVLGVDSSISLGTAQRIVKNKITIQGNLNPNLLRTSKDTIKTFTKKMLDSRIPDGHHIANLGHGVLPQTPVKNVQFFIDAVREYIK